MGSHLRGTAIRPPDTSVSFDDIVLALIDNIETHYDQSIQVFLKQRADQVSTNAVGLELICDEAGYILHEIHHLRRHDPSRLLRVWIHVVKYREVLVDFHLAIDRNPNLPSNHIDCFRDNLRNILTDIRNAEIARNYISPSGSGKSSSIIQGVRNVNMSGGHYAINNYNVELGPELFDKQFRSIFVFAVVLF